MLTGAELARGFQRDVVAPLLAERMPGLRYAAGRLGHGSDVLGLDDATSRDHDWGCRLTLLVDSGSGDAVPAIAGLMETSLPGSYQGFPVRFPASGQTARRHWVDVATVGDFASALLGVSPAGGLTAADWLSLTGQSVLEVTAGPVFADQTTELGPLRELLRWYPPDLERYVLASAWRRIEQFLPFVGRTAERGDDLGSRLLSARLADDLMWLAFAVSRRWPPYQKWRGTMFGTLPVASSLAGPLDAALTAPSWRARERAIADAAEALAAAQRRLGLPVPGKVIVPFWDRPYLSLNEAMCTDLLTGISDPGVLALPPGIGPVERWADSVDVLSSPGRRAATRPLYRAWSS